MTMKDLFNELLEDMNIKDERGKVIALHLYIEEWLDEILKTYANATEIKRKLKFLQKVKLTHAVGIIDDLLLNNLLIINKIRNHYGHVRKPNKEKIVSWIAELKIRPSYDWQGMNKLDAICCLTMMDLDKINEILKKEEY